MKKFSDFEIKMDEQNIFNVPVIHIEDILNCEVQVLDFEPNVKTRHGEGRYIIKISFEGIERKVFTNSTKLKDALDQIPKKDFPFLTTIKMQRFGSNGGKMYYFT